MTMEVEDCTVEGTGGTCSFSKIVRPNRLGSRRQDRNELERRSGAFLAKVHCHRPALQRPAVSTHPMPASTFLVFEVLFLIWAGRRSHSCHVARPQASSPHLLHFQYSLFPVTGNLQTRSPWRPLTPVRNLSSLHDLH